MNDLINRKSAVDAVCNEGCGMCLEAIRDIPGEWEPWVDEIKVEQMKAANEDGPGKAVIDTGVHVENPAGFVGFLKSRSGLNLNNSIISEGVIDSGLTGSIRVPTNFLSDFLVPLWLKLNEVLVVEEDSEEDRTDRVDCRFYYTGGNFPFCSALDRLYCKHEPDCSFYKQRDI